MKTSVELDEKKVREAKQLTAVSTLRELLDKALDAYIARAKRFAMADMLGTGAIDKNYIKRRRRSERAG